MGRAVTVVPDKLAIIAGAGTGKSTLLRKQALVAAHHKRVLYLTFTETNAFEFAQGIRREIGAIPENVTIMTWFSFLLAHGVRPFPLESIPERIDACFMPQGRTRPKRGVRKGDHDYFCNKVGSAYTSRLPELTLACDEQWGGKVFDRISEAFPVIMIDEAQDFSGADYDVMEKLMIRSESMLVVGDPRQSTYRTGNEPLYKGKFKNLFDYLERRGVCPIDHERLGVSYRCPEEIISLANKLYLGMYPEVRAANSCQNGQRVFYLNKGDVKDYADSKSCVALTPTKRTTVPDGIPRINMGESKGMTIPNVIVYPSGDMKKWLKGAEVEWKPGTLAKFYVAITRASESVAFVMD